MVVLPPYLDPRVVEAVVDAGALPLLEDEQLPDEVLCQLGGVREQLLGGGEGAEGVRH